MIFNEYMDILEGEEVVFLDEENLYQLILEAEEPADVKTPSGLSPSDSTATPEERKEASNDPKTAEKQRNEIRENREKGKGLFNWFSKQAQVFRNFRDQQIERFNNRLKDFGDKLTKLKNSGYDGEEIVEIPSKGIDAPPVMPNPTGDPEEMKANYKKFNIEYNKWMKKQNKKMKHKSKIKGAGMILGASWLFKTVSKSGVSLHTNFKSGEINLDYGTKEARKAMAGDGFASALGLIIKNVFLAILVLIGGLFSIIKEYFIALGKIFGVVFATVGNAGKTLVTGEMPGGNSGN